MLIAHSKFNVMSDASAFVTMAPIKTTSFDKSQVTDKQQKPTVILVDKSPNS